MNDALVATIEAPAERKALLFIVLIAGITPPFLAWYSVKWSSSFRLTAAGLNSVLAQRETTHDLLEIDRSFAAAKREGYQILRTVVEMER